LRHATSVFGCLQFYAALRRCQFVYWQFLGLRVERQMKSILQQRLDHWFHLLQLGIRLTQVIVVSAARWGGLWAVPPDRPASGSGGRGLRAGEGARPTKRCTTHQP
jgi:hypothetical protein